MPRYVMEINATGNARSEVDGLANGMGRVTSQAHAMGESLEKVNDHLESIGHSSKADMLLHLSDKLHEGAEKAEEWAEKIKGFSEELVKETIHTASEFEDIKSSMDFNFGAQSDYMYNHALELSSGLAFTFKQTADLVAGLGREGINAYGGMTEAQQTFMTKTGKSENAIAVVQDTLKGLNLSFSDTNRLMKGFHEAVVGNYREFKSLNIAPKVMEEIKHATAGAADMQGKYNAIIEVFAKKFGGASEMAKNNYSFAFAQIADKFELLQNALGGGQGLKFITAGINEFTHALQELVDNKEAIAGLRDGFQMIEKAIGWVFHAAAEIVKFVTGLAATSPWIGKFIAGFMVIGVLASTAAAAALGLAAGVVAVAVAFATIGWEPLLIGVAAVIGLVPVFAALAAIAVPFFLLFQTAGVAVKEDWGGIATTFGKIVIVFQALDELISSYTGKSGTMSVETAKKLKESGMQDFVMDVFGWFNKLSHGWDAFKNTLDDSIEMIKPTFIPMLEEMGDLFHELADAFGFSSAANKLNNSSNKDWIDTGKSMALMLVDITKGIIDFVREAVRITRIVVHFLHLKEVIGFVVDNVKLLYNIVTATLSATQWLLEKTGMIAKTDASGDKTAKTGYHGALTHADAAAEDVGNPFATRARYAGRAYHDDKGAFSVDTDNPMFRALDPEDRERMARGEAPVNEAKKGVDWEQYYKAPRAIAPDDGSGAAEAGNISNAVNSGQVSSLNPEQAELVRQNAAMLAEMRQMNAHLASGTSVQIDGKEIARSTSEYRAGMSGG